MANLTIDELRSELAAVEAQIKELDTQHEGTSFPDEAREEWNALNEKHDGLLERIEEIGKRKERVAALNTATNTEAGFNVRLADTVRGNDVFDLSTVRSTAANPEEALLELRDRAMRVLENERHFPSTITKERAQDHISHLLDSIDGRGDSKAGGELARRILVTGSDLYRRAFGKTIAGRPLDNEEQRALSVGTGSAGGFAVVYQLDPTVVPTSNFSVNPFRAIARNVQIAGTNEWKAITAGAITAAYAAEATQSSDNAPVLAQPDIIVDKAQAFVPFSIELGQDWGGLQDEMGMLLQDAKDDLEATKFAVGVGHGSSEPKGIIVGATATTTAGGVASFAIADLYKLIEALPPRYRPRAQWAGNLFTVDKIRQFDTAGGSGVWIDGSATPDLRGLGPQADAGAYGAVNSTGVPQLLGRNFWESTAMASALTTGQKILIIGDWRYFVIVDRVGMDIEILPQLVGAAQRPTGQRGLYAYWRNSSDVLSAAAFQVLVTG